MAAKKGAQSAKTVGIQTVEERVAKVAQEQGLELVEVILQKESRGKCLLVFVDKDGGISLDDCERYHKQIQPLLEDVDYDILEVSSPGIDRPIKNMRDFEKNRDALVEVKLFAALDGSKLYRGLLKDMNEENVVIEDESGLMHTFARKGVAIIKPVIELDDDDFADVVEDEEE